jgi:hypothetical protein
VREAVTRDRDLQLQIKSLTEQLSRCGTELTALEREELPDLFTEAHMTSFSLEASGNLPAFTAKLSPYFKAVIAADWAPERRAEAFDWIAARDPKSEDGVGPAGGNNPDIIKTVITIELGRGERDLAERVEAGLRKQKIPFSTKLDVPWNTLTAFVRELVEVRKVMPPLDKLGAQVGRIVRVKPEKDK